MTEITANFKKHEEIKRNLSIAELEFVIDCADRLLDEIVDDNLSEFTWELEQSLNPLRRIVDKALTTRVCPKCGQFLLVSDVPEYDYVCSNCDENFYECEARDLIKEV